MKVDDRVTNLFQCGLVAMTSAAVVAVDRRSSDAVRREAQAMTAMMNARMAMMWSGLNVCIFFDGVETGANLLPLPGRGFSPDGAVAEDEGLGVSALDVGDEGSQRGLLRWRAGILVDLRAVEDSEASDVGHMDGVGVVALYSVRRLLLRLEADDYAGGLDDVVVARVAPPDGLPAGPERIDGSGG